MKNVFFLFHGMKQKGNNMAMQKENKKENSIEKKRSWNTQMYIQYWEALRDRMKNGQNWINNNLKMSGVFKYWV